MTGVFKNLAIGVVIFIVITTLINAMVTGTDQGSILLKTLVPLGVGVGIAVYAVVGFLGLGKKGEG